MEPRFRKITVKVGSNVLTKGDGTLNVSRIAHLVEQIAILHKAGLEIVLISSGAVASGRAVLTPSAKTDPVSARQLWAALGQVRLMSRYSDLFREFGLNCAQVLTTKENFSSRAHYLNMKNCINTLLENRVIPIVNENDTISVTELMFTDNDELSGLMATLAQSEALIILSNVDGVYNGPPGDPGSEVIREISGDPESSGVEVADEKSEFGRGGILTKLRIARKVADSGITVLIANGSRENILIDLIAGNNIPYTFFKPSEHQASGVKNWIAYSDSFAKSTVTINEGAVSALMSDKAVSLLPVGITAISGDFRRGDLLRIVDGQKRLIGVGRASFSADKLGREQSAPRQKPLIHYDYLYLEPEFRQKI
ncbi:MAG TPA: glutamate 5-kinase [Prolixibacteraceae bacterium]|nr:glutamate 5-kinase [Prolixibacteraceae bacterium]